MLTDAKIKAAKGRDKAFRLTDSGQLYLQVTPSGGRHWRMNYTFGRNQQNKPVQKTLSFGSYPAVTLLEARAQRDEAKRLLAQGKDPGTERRDAERQAAIAQRNTFQAVSEDWFELNSGWSLQALRNWTDQNNGEWSHLQSDRWTRDSGARWSAVHSRDVLVSLERDAWPDLGRRPIASLEAADILRTLREVEARGAVETAHRLRQRISSVFVYGVAAGICTNDPAANLGTVMKTIPPSRPQPSIIDGLHDQEGRLSAIRQLLIDCEARPGRLQNKLALRLLALTAVRPGELAGARWDEFVDLDGANPFWVIPSDRMKGQKARKKEHFVPLARQAVELLAVLRGLTGRFSLCFPSERHIHRTISENTLRQILINAGYYQKHVPHGFRAAFSTYMNERPAALNQAGDRLVIDLMLAHTPQSFDPAERRISAVSSVEAAYNRALYMPRRRQLAQEWADAILPDFWSLDAQIGRPIR